MGLARIYSKIGSVLITHFNQAAGPNDKRVDAELDRIFAWTKDALRCIHRDFSIVGNVGAGLDVLHTFSLDTPNRLNTDGDYLSVWYAGNFTANDTDKKVNAFFGGTGYEISGLLDFDGASGWLINAKIIRLSSTSVRVHHQYIVNQLFVNSTDALITTFGESFFCVTRQKDITGLANLNNNAMTMEVKGEGGANDDVKQTLTIIELCQQ